LRVCVCANLLNLGQVYSCYKSYNITKCLGTAPSSGHIVLPCSALLVTYFSWFADSPKKLLSLLGPRVRHIMNHSVPVFLIFNSPDAVFCVQTGSCHYIIVAEQCNGQNFFSCYFPLMSLVRYLFKTIAWLSNHVSYETCKVQREHKYS